MCSQDSYTRPCPQPRKLDPGLQCNLPESSASKGPGVGFGSPSASRSASPQAGLQYERNLNRRQQLKAPVAQGNHRHDVAFAGSAQAHEPYALAVLTCPNCVRSSLLLASLTDRLKQAQEHSTASSLGALPQKQVQKKSPSVQSWQIQQTNNRLRT